jgi:hypothetical protein
VAQIPQAKDFIKSGLNMMLSPMGGIGGGFNSNNDYYGEEDSYGEEEKGN